MKVPSSIQVNHVSFQTLLVVVLTLQFALWTVMGLNALGWQVPVVQQLIGFIYLTFVPGILILSILRVYHLRTTETVLYTVGLSISVVLSIGFVANLVFNALNIIKPFSFLAVTSSVSLAVLVLCGIAYSRNRTYPKPFFDTKMSVPLAPTLFLCVIPFIAVFSTYLVNYYNVSAGQLLLYLLVGVVVLLVAFDRFIPSALYPLAVFVISLTLIFTVTLLGTWVRLGDVFIEWGLANEVLKTGVWNPNVFNNYASMLSVVVLAPIYSLISSLELVWVFRLVYPIILALVPVCLYQIFRRQLNNKVAFLSCFFFMSNGVFFLEMITIGRQEIGELFFVLFILLLVSKEINKKIQSALLLVFALSLVVSHYSLTYLLVIFLFVMWLVLTALPYLRTLGGIHKDEQRLAPSPESPPKGAVTIVFILLFFITAMTWSMYGSNSSIIIGIGNNVNRILSSITELFSPSVSLGAQALQQTQASSIVNRINQFQNYLNEFLIVAGVCLTIFLKKQRFKLQSSYVVLSIIALGFLFTSVAVPFVGAILYQTRLYQIMLLFLAPFLAVGFIEIGERAGVTMSKAKSKLGFGPSVPVNLSRLTRLLAIYIVVFMLFQTGFILTLTTDYQTTTLSNQVIDQTITHQEIVGATWLSNNSGGQDIYTDLFKINFINSFGGNSTSLLDPQNASAGSFYIFLGTYNIEHKQVLVDEYIGLTTFQGSMYNYTNVTPFISSRSLIYSNGGAQVYR
jgi:uncharacterized membrane protein